MRNEPWVWPEVRDAGTSGAGAVPLRSAQLMGQQKKKKKKKKGGGGGECPTLGIFTPFFFFLTKCSRWGSGR